MVQVDRGASWVWFTLCTATAKETLWRWLIDDGNAKRNNRKLLLAPEFTHLGVGAAYNVDYQQVTLLALAVDFHETK